MTQALRLRHRRGAIRNWLVAVGAHKLKPMSLRPICPTALGA
jgi:hypothetical protein